MLLPVCLQPRQGVLVGSICSRGCTFPLTPSRRNRDICTPNLAVDKSHKSALAEEEYQHSATAATELAVFGPLIYECEQANRTVNGSHSIVKWQDLIKEKSECISKAMV